MNNRSPAPILITGLGMVTPLGWETDIVWQRLCAGEHGIRSTIQSPVSGRVHRCAQVEGFSLDQIVQTGRVRRSSSISHFALGAAALALRDATLKPHPAIGVIVAVSRGGVRYTRNFHGELIQGGARNVSPMLFPETVFNAPASHIAAVFGLTDTNYTVVGDACAAANALAMAMDLIGMGLLEQCLVVAAEELDWITLEAYRNFGFVCSPDDGAEMMRPFSLPRSGFLAGEGSVALLLESAASASSRGALSYAGLGSCDRGFPFQRRPEIPLVLSRAIRAGLESARIGWADVGGVICSANGTFVDRAEATVLRGLSPAGKNPMPVTSIKGAGGESHPASCLLQVAAAALAIRHGQLPPTVGTERSILEGSGARLLTRAHSIERQHVLVLCVGFNQQVSVIILAGDEPGNLTATGPSDTHQRADAQDEAGRYSDRRAPVRT